MPRFGAAERHIARLLHSGCAFVLGRDCYTIIESGKPTCRKGEPKTDIYVAAESDRGKVIEIKISYKKDNADFIENKTSSERAEALFGVEWSEIIQDATESISRAFDNKKLIFKTRGGRTQAGAITLGWKYELLNKPGGELSGRVNLTRDQIIDVYAGTHLSIDKRDASVNGRVIRYSGVANYVLMGDDFSSTQEVIDNLYTVEEYVDIHPEIYFACKALNYRTFEGKYDGNRPLSVYVHWYVRNGRLCHRLVYDRPLLVGGNIAADYLLNALGELGVDTTDDICDEMLAEPSIIHDNS